MNFNDNRDFFKLQQQVSIRVRYRINNNYIYILPSNNI